MMDFKNTLRVGLVVGHGTGAESAEVFENVMQKLAARHSLAVEFVRPNRIYKSLPTAESDDQLHPNETMDDATHYQKFCEEEAARGLRVIYRTPMSAHSIYETGKRLKAVKVSYFERGPASFLIVRDQAQGLYAGHNQLHEDQVVVSSVSQFSKSIFHDIISFAIKRARETWGDLKCLNLVYKFHLPDGLFPEWAQQWTMEFGLRIRFVKPDDMNKKLIASEARGPHLVVAGNEDADNMEGMLRNMSQLGVQEATHAETVYLHPSMNYLSEYQIAHDLAGDITEKGTVNPSAIIRAAAAILERHGNCTGIEEQVDKTLRILQRQNNITPAQGENSTTSAFVDSFLQKFPSPGSRPPVGDGSLLDSTLLINSDEANSYQAPDPSLAFMGKSTAVMVIDFQNDIVSYGSSESIADKIARVVYISRAHGQDVLFTRYIGDSRYQGPSLRHRNSVQKQESLCMEGSPGAEISTEIAPMEGECIFDKEGYFDAFLNTEFVKYIADRRFEHLILLGLYADMAIDATAKTAFQKGLWVTVVRDCTKSSYLPEEDLFKYMQNAYGTRVVRTAELWEMKS